MNSPTQAISVADLVPHRRGMSWLDRIIHVDDTQAQVQAEIRADSFFVRNSQLNVWIGIEYMAQAVAAWAGHRARQEGRSMAIGFLVGTRRYEAYRQTFRVGECLHIEAVCELMSSNGLGMFACRIVVGETLAASANLAVFEPPDGAAFLESIKGGEPC